MDVIIGSDVLCVWNLATYVKCIGEYSAGVRACVNDWQGHHSQPPSSYFLVHFACDQNSCIDFLWRKIVVEGNATREVIEIITTLSALGMKCMCWYCADNQSVSLSFLSLPLSCNQSHGPRIFIRHTSSSSLFYLPLFIIYQTIFMLDHCLRLRARRIGKLIHSSHLVLYIINLPRPLSITPAILPMNY